VGERAKVKFKYSRQKIVWEVIDRLVRSGYIMAQVAIDKIYDVYGRVSILDIIKKIRQDAQNGVQRVPSCSGPEP
jgi:hypothetical protein